MTIMTYDLLTQEEYEAYTNLMSVITQLKKSKLESKQSGQKIDDEVYSKFMQEKNEAKQRYLDLIKSNNKERQVQLSRVLIGKYIDGANGVSWDKLKTSKKIAQFASEGSRSMGLNHLDITFDKIILKWASIEILEQLVLNGFYMNIQTSDGTVYRKHYKVLTASAGQLRTDKVQCISDDMWAKIEKRLQCGLDWNAINEAGGINQNKYMAYLGLPFGATDPWDISIDRTIVVDDFEGQVTGLMEWIKPDYSSERLIHTITIPHTDGCGMVHPSVSQKNFMVRGPWIKGLLSPFDYIGFCRQNNIQAKIKDIWGQEHDLIAENIQIIFTKSQFKLWKYYENWEHYKRCFKENGCQLSRTNYEQDYIPDTDICYQMLQTLTDFTDEEIDTFTAQEKKRIKDIAQDKYAMLRTLGADKASPMPYRRALAIYPELLRDGYAKESLKSIKKRMILNARSGKIRCKNKRLFVVPDLYACCEYWFLGISKPQGILQNGEVACRPYCNREKIACLRSPHLYMEWTIRKINNNDKVKRWFCTDGVYTSCHDLISRVLQFDVDGDQLNCIAEDLLIAIAERNIEQHNIIPLYYDLGKAGNEILSRQTLFNGLKRAHDFSGIGQISNKLTKLWNRPNPDRQAAALLCYYNNLVIDAAKTGQINDYAKFPKINEQINKATGGNTGKMPYFFQFSKNGRKERSNQIKKKKTYANKNKSTMNRICSRFENFGRMHMGYSSIPPFSYEMLMPGPLQKYNEEAVNLFCQMDDSNVSNVIQALDNANSIYGRSAGYDFVAEAISVQFTSKFGGLYQVYPSITKYLFSGNQASKQTHKQMFWRVFGDIAVNVLQMNLKSSSSCRLCGQKYPSWVSSHHCDKAIRGFVTCCDCGKIVVRVNSKQKRCETCQAESRRKLDAQRHRTAKQKKEE